MSACPSQVNGLFFMLAITMLTFIIGLKLSVKFERAGDMLDLFFGIVIVAGSAVSFVRYGLRITHLNGR